MARAFDAIVEAFKAAAPEGRRLLKLGKMIRSCGAYAVSDRGVVAEIDYELALRNAKEAARRFWRGEELVFADLEQSETEFSRIADAIEDDQEVRDAVWLGMRDAYPLIPWGSGFFEFTDDMQETFITLARDALGDRAPAGELLELEEPVLAAEDDHLRHVQAAQAVINDALNGTVVFGSPEGVRRKLSGECVCGGTVAKTPHARHCPRHPEYQG